LVAAIICVNLRNKTTEATEFHGVKFRIHVKSMTFPLCSSVNSVVKIHKVNAYGSSNLRATNIRNIPLYAVFCLTKEYGK